MTVGTWVKHFFGSQRNCAPPPNGKKQPWPQPIDSSPEKRILRNTWARVSESLFVYIRIHYIMFNYRYSHLSCQCANVLKTPLHLRKNSFPPLHLVVLPPYSPKNLVKRKVSLQKGEVSPATENLSAKNCVYTFFFLLPCISGPSPLPLLDLLLKALHFLGNLYQRSHKILPIKPRNSLKHRLHTLVQRLPKRVCQRTASLFQVNDPRTATVDKLVVAVPIKQNHVGFMPRDNVLPESRTSGVAFK